MKLDALLRTRDFDTDYRWIFYPSYLNPDMEKQLSFMMRMMLDSQRKQYFAGENLQNIFYIYGLNGSVLVRCGFSDSVDRQGRAIQSVEGLACPPEQNRIFWYALPYLIDRLASVPLLRDRWMRGDNDRKSPQSRRLEFSSLTEDCLFMEPEETGSIWQLIGDKTPCMDRLMKDIRTSPEMFSFVYGTREKSFYPVSLKRYYTPEELDQLEEIQRKIIDTDPQPALNEAESRYRLEIEIKKQTGGRYAAVIVARDMKGEAIGETDPMTFGKGGIPLVQIEKGRIALDQKLAEAGYRRGGAAV